MSKWFSENDEQFFEDDLFREFQDLIGKNILIVTQSPQLNLLGQTFRPIFTGEVNEVEPGHVTLFPVIIKIVNAPFYNFPLPLSIPFERIAVFTPDWDPDKRFPLT
ncbi:hypothetical protein ACDX78_01655 [Virgibacillus oceani]